MISGQIPTSALPVRSYADYFAPQSLSFLKARNLCLCVPLSTGIGPLIGGGGWGEGSSGKRELDPVSQESKEESHLCKSLTAQHTDTVGWGHSARKRDLWGSR